MGYESGDMRALSTSTTSLLVSSIDLYGTAGERGVWNVSTITKIIARSWNIL